ncbi:MAG: hypothetical protein GY725_19105 [bacterium]|nr:hypothetical protein [bacterium]
MSILGGLSDGCISPSAYDTAWIARIPAHGNPLRPMYPQCLEWVLSRQLPDGSWGCAEPEYCHDRLISTLSAIVALRSWDAGAVCVERGMAYVERNLPRLSEESISTVGFELIFPTLVESARQVRVQWPAVDAMMSGVAERRRRKIALLERHLYAAPTTILHSLEGFSDADRLDFEQILRLQAQNGSFLNSPAATAFVFMQTGDSNALAYIDGLLQRFGDCVPVTYPLDLFERLWVLDNLAFLGIDGFFREEIRPHLEYIRRHWSECGMPWGRDVQVPDLDDTAVAFKILRREGEDLSAEVFEKYRDGDRYVCFAGELDTSFSHMLHLYEASELGDEEELRVAESICREFLVRSVEEGELDDKWYVSSGNEQLVRYHLDRRAGRYSPREERAAGFEAYRNGILDRKWIEKVIYSLPNVDDPIYLEFAESVSAEG